MKSLFDSDGRLTPEGLDLSIQATKSIEPLFACYIGKHYAPNEISYIMLREIIAIACEYVIEKTS
jgi:hypothetical protein